MSIAYRFHATSFAYGDHPVLRETTLDIPSGKFTVLFGRNGSGKSTLLRLMGSLLPGYDGSIQCLGRELSDWKHKEFARTVGYLGQHHRPVFPFSVEDVILTGRAGHAGFLPSKKDEELVQRVMEEVGIGEFRGRRYTELSGGEQQLVLLARVLAKEPEIILLDEPTNHLDVAHQIEILSFIRMLVRQRGITVISAIHDPNAAFLYGDEILFLHDRQLIRDDAHQPWDSPVLKHIIPRCSTVTENNITMIVPH